jgi:excisionase family DNA binding protein
MPVVIPVVIPGAKKRTIGAMASSRGSLDDDGTLVPGSGSSRDFAAALSELPAVRPTSSVEAPQARGSALGPLLTEVEQTRPKGRQPRRDEPALIPYRADRLAISVSEASAALGCSVSTVYRMIRSGHLGSARSTANGRIFVNLQSVRDFVEGEGQGAAARAAERIRQLG